MRLLLDECVTNYLKLDFAAHDVFTVEEAGLKGLKNGKLISAASGNFDVLITVDKSVPHQQNISSLSIAVLILRAKTNTYPDLKPLVPQALAALDEIRPGEIVIVRS